VKLQELRAEAIREQLSEENPDAMFADDLDDALVGIARRPGQPALAAYDYTRVVRVFEERDGLSREDAIEWVEFNVVSAWLGENTPVWITRMSGEYETCPQCGGDPRRPDLVMSCDACKEGARRG